MVAQISLLVAECWKFCWALGPLDTLDPLADPLDPLAPLVSLPPSLTISSISGSHGAVTMPQVPINNVIIRPAARALEGAAAAAFSILSIPDMD